MQCAPLCSSTTAFERGNMRTMQHSIVFPKPTGLVVNGQCSQIRWDYSEEQVAVGLLATVSDI